MIDPELLKPGDIGREVRYRPMVGKPEFGTLTSWNRKYVFVRFKGPNGEACNPTDVEFTGAKK